MVTFAKGHGTRNDFVLFTDADDAEPLSPAQVRHLADRRGGVGGDGVLRAVRGAHVPEWEGDPDAWFMDYRNADGSLAEMCGNGVRVFARYLVEQGLAGGGDGLGLDADAGHVRLLGIREVKCRDTRHRQYPRPVCMIGNISSIKHINQCR